MPLVETFTGGQIAARIGHLPGAEHVFRRGVVVRDLAELHRALDMRGMALADDLTAGDDRGRGTRGARARRRHARSGGADRLDEGADRIDFGGTIWIGIATEEEVDFRRSRILGGRDWVRLGAVELGLDCLRRYLQGLPVVERIDFERT